jgi:hypothetical protein
MATRNTSSKSKSRKLHVIPHKARATTLRLGGMEPAEEMAPGDYLVACLSAVVERGRVVLHYQVIEGPHTGTGLRQWITIPQSGTISPNSRYAQQAAVALGRPVDTRDNLNNPGSIFQAQFFRGAIFEPSSDSERLIGPGEGNRRMTSLSRARTRTTGCGFTRYLVARSYDGLDVYDDVPCAADVHVYMEIGLISVIRYGLRRSVHTPRQGRD